MSCIILAVAAALSRILPDCSFAYFVAIIGVSYEYQRVHNKTRLLAKFYFLFTLFTLHWIYIPFTFDEQTRAFAPLAVFVLPAYIPLYYWGWEKILGRVDLCKRYRLVLVIALSELCCTHLLTGFPWMNSGYAWATNITMLQIASLIGVNGLGFVMNLCASVLGISLYEYIKDQRYDFNKLTFSGLVIALVAAFGACRLRAPTTYTDTTIRLVQASIAQETKNSSKNYDDILAQNIALSLRAPAVDLIIWPEACIPWLYTERSAPIINKYLDKVTQNCRYLISGVCTKTLQGDCYNSVVAFDSQGSKNIYNKTHLLPFGEYMPLRRFISARSIASVISDFSFGDGHSKQLPGIPQFQTCICYESIFENEFMREEGTQWILNVTNDGWYKTSNENFQHDNISRILSVEYGLPMVRVNNLGISSVFDAYGRRVKSLSSGTVNTLDIQLPTRIKPTPYSQLKKRICEMVTRIGL